MLGREVRLPAELMYGSQCNDNWETQSYGQYVDHLHNKMQHAHEVAREHLASSAKKQAKIYESKLSVYKYYVGDLFWVTLQACGPGNSPKLQASYCGPCLITQKYNDLNFKVKLSSSALEQVLHHNKMKPYQGENVPDWVHRVRSRLRVKDTD